MQREYGLGMSLSLPGTANHWFGNPFEEVVVPQSETPPPFVLNCSRVGLSGGLKTFSDELMAAIVESGLPCHAVLPAGYPIPDSVSAVLTPSSLAGGSNLSLLRPIKGLVYSRFRFPVPRDQRVLSTTHHALPGRSKQIVTIHDLRPYFFPDTPVQKFYFHVMLPRTLSSCDGVLTVSESSRRLISETYGVSKDRIAVVPNSVSTVPTRRAAYAHHDTPYLLSVGASWSHKNIESLLKMHRLWASRFRLKIIAGEGPYRRFLSHLAADLGVQTRVDFLSGVSRRQLDGLYDECAALVYPSRMEGFGLPPLEAMAHGRPAIVSDIDVFRELYGPYAIYVNVDDQSSWEDALRRIPMLDEGFLAGAQAHAATFTRRRMARAFTDALRRFWPDEEAWCRE